MSFSQSCRCTVMKSKQEINELIRISAVHAGKTNLEMGLPLLCAALARKALSDCDAECGLGLVKQHSLSSFGRGAER